MDTDLGRPIRLLIGLLIVVSVTRMLSADREATAARPAFNQSTSESQFGDEEPGRSLTPEEREGRNTWYLWTGGNETFWPKVAARTGGAVNLLAYIDSRRHGRRFQELGVITQPGCVAANHADAFGIWIDQCIEPELPAEYGKPTGVLGLRRFDNPNFDPRRWNASAYAASPGTMEAPYRVGITCSFCHASFNPLSPPADPERPRWNELAPAIGNQYWREGRMFSLDLPPDDFRRQLGDHEPPGTADTSRFATDHIDNPSAINTIVGLADRPLHEERAADGSVRRVPRLLKDGADSLGLEMGALRVYANLGMCGDYTLTLFDPVVGLRAQRPFSIAHARSQCAEWRATEQRIPALIAFLQTTRPARLVDAPGSMRFLPTDRDTLERGMRVFADTCARCHSSKQPPPEIGNNPPKALAWYRASVAAPDFLDGNFLSDDERYSVREIGTNAGRALAANATRGHLWSEFSSETYKTLPPVGTLDHLFNPQQPDRPLTIAVPAGGPGYYRTPSLIGMWATAPYLHNNSVGVFTGDPSVEGRLAGFVDGVEKMLWPERRGGGASIARTGVPSTFAVPRRSRRLVLPTGTPIDLVANVDASRVSWLVMNPLTLNIASDTHLVKNLIRYNAAPDFVLDRGHTFGASLPDSDKLALAAFLRTF